MLAFNNIFHYNHRIWRQNLVMRLRHKKNAENLIQDSPMIINNQDTAVKDNQDKVINLCK